MYGWGVAAGLALGVGYNRNEIKSIIADTPFLSMEDLEERESQLFCEIKNALQFVNRIFFFLPF